MAFINLGQTIGGGNVDCNGSPAPSGRVQKRLKDQWTIGRVYCSPSRTRRCELKCSKCSRTIEDGARFCGACGTPSDASLDGTSMMDVTTMQMKMGNMWSIVIFVTVALYGAIVLHHQMVRFEAMCADGMQGRASIMEATNHSADWQLIRRPFPTIIFQLSYCDW